jgi:hypothetical protein
MLTIANDPITIFPQRTSQLKAAPSCRVAYMNSVLFPKIRLLSCVAAIINSFKALENRNPPLFDISDWNDRRNKKLRKLCMTKAADKTLIPFFLIRGVVSQRVRVEL